MTAAQTRQVDTVATVGIAEPSIHTERGILPIPALTGLRFVAAILIYWHHFPLTPAGSARLATGLHNIKFAGYIGVPLFFMLSGFVLTHNYFRVFKVSPWKGLWRYLVNRFARIYPMLLFVMVLSVAATGFQTPLQRSPQTLLEHLTITYVWDGDVTQTVQQAYNGVNSSSWSLGVEFFLYALFPFLVWGVVRQCGTKARIVVTGLLLTGLSAVGAHWVAMLFHDQYAAENYWLNRFPIPHIAEFTVGCLAARFYHEMSTSSPSKWEQLWGKLAFGGSVVVVVGLMASRNQPAHPSAYLWSAAYMIPLAIILFCLARYTTIASRFLSLPFLILLGEASYSFYLLHMFFLDRMVSPADRKLDYIYSMMPLALLILSAVGAYTFLETPARRYLRTWLAPERGRRMAQQQTLKPDGLS